MGSVYASDVVKMARSYIGTMEDPAGSNRTIFGYYLDQCNYFIPQKKNGISWCGTFCDCMVMFAARPQDRSNNDKKYDAQYVLFQPSYNNYSCGVNEFASYFKNAGEFYLTDPQPGDIVFFRLNTGKEHCGIIETVDGDRITTIEGNSVDAVRSKTYYRSDSSNGISGYGRPRYDKDSTDPDKEVNITIKVNAPDGVKVNINVENE